MNNSNYYYNLMCSYSKSKRDFQDKKASYENYLKILKKFVLNLDSVTESLKNAESNFLNGGYIDRGITLDNGVLKKNYIELDNNVSYLNDVIKRTEEKINEYINKLNEYTNLYSEAKSNYEKAKRNEKM